MSFVISEEKNQMKTEPQGLKRNGAEKERVSAMKLGIGLYPAAVMGGVGYLYVG